MAKSRLTGMKPETIISKVSKLKGERANWDDLWQECYEYCCPRKDEVTIKRAPGEKKYVGLLDSTAMTSTELLAGALHGMLTNPSGYFFGLSTGKPELDRRDATRKYLQQTVRRIHEVLNNSNFQTEVHELYLDEVAIGNSCMLIEEDTDLFVRFSTRAIREVFVEENSKGVVDTVYRCFKMDARALCDEFGYDEMPKKIQDAYNKGDTKEWGVVHGVYPRKKAGISPDKTRFSFISQYVLEEEKKTISVGGFNEFPYVFPRWSKASGEKYGRGPGEKALPSAKTLNKMRETVLRGAQKVVDPPLQAPDDGFLLPLVTKPGGLNFYRAGTNDRVEPILNDSRIDFGYQAIDQERVQVREALYTDQLKLREGPQMTATEVSERVEQALRFLGPMLGRQQSEFLAPLIMRVYSILDRRGELPDVPAELDGVPLKIQYTSVMAMSQRLSEVQNIQRTMTNIAPFTAADPSVLDNFDGDAAVRYIAQLFNYPQEILRDADAIANIRKQRQQAQQQQAEMMKNQVETDSAAKLVSAGAKANQTRAA